MYGSTNLMKHPHGVANTVKCPQMHREDNYWLAAPKKRFMSAVPPNFVALVSILGWPLPPSTRERDVSPLRRALWGFA